jgi:hypothetical protein
LQKQGAVAVILSVASFHAVEYLVCIPARFAPGQWLSSAQYGRIDRHPSNLSRKRISAGEEPGGRSAGLRGWKEQP